MGMRKSKTATSVQQIDVMRTRQTISDLVRQLEKSAKPVELVRKGKVVARVVPAEAEEYVDATPEAQARAWKEIQKIQRKAGKAVAEQGITEEDVIAEVLKDD